MKNRNTFPLLAAALGLAAFALRLLQTITGREADTGLPIPGSIPGLLLPVLLAVAAAVLFRSARALPKGPVEQPFSAVFSTKEPLALTLLVLGLFLMAASGLWEILRATVMGDPIHYLTAEGLTHISNRGASGRSALLMGTLSVLAAASVFPAVKAAKQREEAVVPTENAQPLTVLAAPVCLLARVILDYRLCSVDPVLSNYYLELLSLALLVLGFYRLSGFTVRSGSPRYLALYAGLSAVVALPLLADGIAPASLLGLGGAAVLIGFALIYVPVEDA